MPDIDLVKDSTMSSIGSKLDSANIFLAAIASNGGGIAVESWADVQRVVRLGLADKIFSPGDQLCCARGENTLTWDVLGFDRDTPADPNFTHSMTIGLHDCLDSLQFSAPQAVYKADDDLPSGAYYFVSGSSYYCFSLGSAVTSGSQLVYSESGNVKKISVYATALSAAPEQQSTVTVRSSSPTGTLLTPVNDLTRSQNGSNRFSQSALRIWLGSDDAAGSVWAPVGDYDRVPAWQATADGFLRGLDSDFLAATGEVVKRTVLNTVCDGGGYEDTVERFFLLSASEVGCANENTIPEGEPYPYYSAFCGNARVNTALAGRVKRCGGTACMWWLRSPYSSSACSERMIDITGARSYHGAYRACGVSPACCIV